MAFVLGMKGYAYYDEQGINAGTPDWQPLDNVRDLTLSLEASESDATVRANAGWRATVAALKDATVDFEMVWDDADAGFTAIKNAFLNNTLLGMRILDGPDTVQGSQGLEADMMVTNFSRAEPLEEVMMTTVTMRVTYSDNAPNWYVSPAPP